MQNNQIYIEQVKKSLIELNPYLILLFGSYAYGEPNDESDIDLLVVTNDNYMPQNYDERLMVQLKVSKHIFNFSKQVPIDLIVFTKPMYQKFIDQKSSFSNEIISKGKILYERNNPTMA